jgi:hypothetical protein
VLELRLSNGEVLEPTPPHRFYSETRQDWVAAGELPVGECLRTASGQAVTVEPIALKAGEHRLYNLEVEQEHQFYVGEGGVLVHKAYKEGDVVPGEEDAHRIGGGDAENLALKPAEARLDPPGISVHLGGTPEEAAAAMRSVFGPRSTLGKQAGVVGTAELQAIRDMGFDVMPKPTSNFPNHGRLIHPGDGAAGFTPGNLEELSQVFTNKRGG